ncbi:MAG: DUF711 family protein [Lawsonella clevelandensis]
MGRMGEVVKQAAELTADQQGLGAAKLVVFANAVGDNPFMAGAFHGVEEPDCVVSVGVSGPGVIKRALENFPTASFGAASDVIKKAAFKITVWDSWSAVSLRSVLECPLALSTCPLAPTAAVGDSVARILEELGLERVGAPRHHCRPGAAQ